MKDTNQNKDGDYSSDHDGDYISDHDGDYSSDNDSNYFLNASSALLEVYQADIKKLKLIIDGMYEEIQKDRATNLEDDIAGTLLSETPKCNEELSTFTFEDDIAGTLFSEIAKCNEKLSTLFKNFSYIKKNIGDFDGANLRDIKYFFENYSISFYKQYNEIEYGIKDVCIYTTSIAKLCNVDLKQLLASSYIKSSMLEIFLYTKYDTNTINSNLLNELISSKTSTLETYSQIYNLIDRLYFDIKGKLAKIEEDEKSVDLSAIDELRTFNQEEQSTNKQYIFNQFKNLHSEILKLNLSIKNIEEINILDSFCKRFKISATQISERINKEFIDRQEAKAKKDLDYSDCNSRFYEFYEFDDLFQQFLKQIYNIDPKTARLTKQLYNSMSMELGVVNKDGVDCLIVKDDFDIVYRSYKSCIKTAELDKYFKENNEEIRQSKTNQIIDNINKSSENEKINNKSSENEKINYLKELEKINYLKELFKELESDNKPNKPFEIMPIVIPMVCNELLTIDPHTKVNEHLCFLDIG